jgi:hypothetical protein
MPLPNNIERHLTGEFKHGQLNAWCSVPGECCFFCCCTPCAIYAQRKRMLDITKEPYVCCAGVWPCCGFERPRDECCLVAEACCLPSLAIAGNRFMMQTRFNKKNSGCVDSLGKICHICVACECCVARICCECSQEREDIMKSAACVCTNSHCQNASELDNIDVTVSYAGPPRGVVQELPVHFFNAGVSGGTASAVVVSAPAQVVMPTSN